MGCGSSVQVEATEGGFSKEQKAQITRTAARIWKSVDRDKSGHLTKEEIRTFFNNDEELVGKMLKDIDVDGEGCVSEIEWRNYWLVIAMKSNDVSDYKKWEEKMENYMASKKSNDVSDYKKWEEKMENY